MADQDEEERKPLVGEAGEADAEMTPGQTFRTQAVVNATALVDSADAVILPAVFRAFEVKHHDLFLP